MPRPSFQLPFTPDSDKVTADCDRGLLIIKLPKNAVQDKSRRISIGGSSQRTIEGTASEGSAIGKDWAKEPEGNSREGELSGEQAEKGQGAPA